MRRNVFKISVFIFAVVILALIFCGCDLRESHNNFRGGELLDAERMSDIKESLLNESRISDTETSKNTEKTSDKQTEIFTETQSNTELEMTTEESNNDSESTSKNEDNDESDDLNVVYWIKGGTVWHLSDECYHISNKDILSGTVEEAMEAGKTKVCSSCSKKFT